MKYFLKYNKLVITLSTSEHNNRSTKISMSLTVEIKAKLFATLIIKRLSTKNDLFFFVICLTIKITDLNKRLLNFSFSIGFYLLNTDVVSTTKRIYRN